MLIRSEDIVDVEIFHPSWSARARGRKRRPYHVSRATADRRPLRSRRRSRALQDMRRDRRSSRRVRSGYLKRRRAGGVPRLRCRRKRPRQSRYTAQSPVRRPPGRTQRQRAASVLNQQSSVVVPACWLRSGLVLMLARERSLLVEDVVDVAVG